MEEKVCSIAPRLGDIRGPLKEATVTEHMPGNERIRADYLPGDCAGKRLNPVGRKLAPLLGKMCPTRGWCSCQALICSVAG